MCPLEQYFFSRWLYETVPRTVVVLLDSTDYREYSVWIFTISPGAVGEIIFDFLFCSRHCVQCSSDSNLYYNDIVFHRGRRITSRIHLKKYYPFVNPPSLYSVGNTVTWNPTQHNLRSVSQRELKKDVDSESPPKQGDQPPRTETVTQVT